LAATAADMAGRGHLLSRLIQWNTGAE